MNAVIVEDDSLSSDLLRALLGRVTPPVQVVGQAGTIEEARSLLTRTEYDVVFLDIQLVGGNGFDLVPDVRPDAGIIFVTGCDDQAVRAFEVNAVDYIVKPVTAPRLARALKQMGHAAAAHGRETAKLQPTDRIFLRGAAAGGRFARLDEVVAILSSENYSEVLLADGERWFIRRTLQSWEGTLPTEQFQRVHRTTIVNMGAIERVERGAGERTALKIRAVRQPIPVSRAAWRQLRVRLADRSQPGM